MFGLQMRDIMRRKFRHLLLTMSVVMICALALFSNVVGATSMPSAGTANLTIVDISQWNDSVSSSNDDINFPLLKTQVDAVYIRTYGNSNGVPYIDMQANRFAQSAQTVNLLYGFYYYYIPTSDSANARSQAQSYYNFVKNYAYSCVPVLDVEENPNNLSKAELAASVRSFADEFKSLSGVSVMIYSYPDFIARNFDPAQNWIAYKLWIAHYNVLAPMEGISSTWMPSSKWCWERWDMWQSTSAGSLSSIPNSSSGSLDISHATDNILLSTPTAITTIDLPSATGVNGGDITISGWALNHAGVSRVDIYADNFRPVGSATMHGRPDVQQTVNSNGRYNDGLHSGFSYTVDASYFTVGAHTLQIAVLNRNGTVNWSFYDFTVGPEPQMSLETPSSGAVSGDISVSGWALSHAGVTRVDIYVDNFQGLGSTSSMGLRGDVNSIINSSGQYKDGLHSGFSYTIDASLLTPGKHILRVAAISRDGTAQWTEREIIVGPEPQMSLETPSSGAVSGDINVSGWALSHAGVARVDIYVDNFQGLGSTSSMSVRSDVNSIINSSSQYKDGLHSGFSYTIAAGLLAPGKHILRVAAISRDGTAQWAEKEISVQ